MRRRDRHSIDFADLRLCVSQIQNELLEQMDTFPYLGSLISEDGECTTEFRTRLNAFCYTVPSVLWRCWLGGRKGIRPVKNWVVGCCRGYLSGVRCRLAYGPADATASVKSILVLPFWYLLTWVAPDKRFVKRVCVYVKYIQAAGFKKCLDGSAKLISCSAVLGPRVGRTVDILSPL